MRKTLIVIAGPTAAGKTQLALDIASFFNTEIISADSRQFFKELNIGVARPSREQLARVKHHFIACRSVSEAYAAGQFEKDALDALEKIFLMHDVAVLAGGSGLYVKAVCEGLDPVPAGSHEVRAALMRELEEKGLSALQQQLRELDPEYYSKADINNPRRVLRALEVCLATGLPFSRFHRATIKQRDFWIIKIGLMPERNLLYKNIDARVEIMMETGLLEEVKQLVPFKKATALQTVGYKELFDYLDGKIELKTAVELIKQNTRNFAKRQITWFKKDEGIVWFESNADNRIIEYLKERMCA